MWKLALIFVALFGALPARAEPVTFEGEGLSIVHDGSPTAFNPHTEAGRRLLRDVRESCCVEAPAAWHGLAEMFAFNTDEERHLFHQAKRFVINPRTGAFVSSTTLEDTHFPITDQRRYVDADITPMVALSDEQAAACGCKPGDRVLVSDPQSSRSVWAVYGENAGTKSEGLAHTELSTAAADALLIPLDATSRDPKQIGYKLKLTVYPGSGYGSRFPHGRITPAGG